MSHDYTINCYHMSYTVKSLNREGTLTNNQTLYNSKLLSQPPNPKVLASMQAWLFVAFTVQFMYTQNDETYF